MEEIKKYCNKTFYEIQRAFQDNLISVSIRSSHDIPKKYSKLFLSKLGLIRRKIERSAVGFVDGNYYMLLSDYRKQRISIYKGSEEIDLKTLVDDTTQEIKDYYFKLSEKYSLSLDINNLFEIKLVIKSFPTLNINQYERVHKINDDIDKEEVLNNIKEYVDNLTLEIYKQFKDNLMYKEYIETSRETVKLEEVLDKHSELLYLTKTVKGKYSRDDYYRDNDFENTLIDEIERQRAIWYYYKISHRIEIEDKGKRTIKPKVLDGFYKLKEKAIFFYDATEDQEFKKQYDMILETNNLIEEYKTEVEHKKIK
ncbi:hypothetical protein [uncultured Tissierella sp.]|uniref:hypothetical protein n=1 Tax=uncultured Tissierella sp. TaxID=448160 RepID=UPI0028049A3C|nr:hypothetical protein [uncultured Tissierella sp.]MDU5082839.1 hypothetical protein [Bacillota bacterium]